jgi:hypothetical protein
MKTMFALGDKVFKANYGRHEKWVVCPDCFGSKHVKVVLGDGTEIVIECGGCDPGGYQPSTGRIRQYEYSTEVKEYTVTGISTGARDGVRYELNNFGGGSYYTGDGDEVFGTREEAYADGEKKRLEHESEENKRWMAKTKNHRSWSWNATYHRNCIKDLERQIEHHRRKVQICAAKAKEE